MLGLGLRLTSPSVLGGASSVFSDAWGRWRADNYSGSSPNITLTDLTGNARTMTQQAGTLTPGTAGNGQARIAGGATAYLTNGTTLPSWPVTMVTFGRRTAAATCGLFGHTGATGYNTLWYGHEASNSHRIYGTNSTNNTDSTGGSDTCWIGRVGYGSRVSFINGIVQSDNVHSSATIASVATSIGTQYRGLNFDWYETIVWNRPLSIAEIDSVHTYGNSRYGMSIPLWSSYTPAKVLCFHGQSNAAGRAARGAADVNVDAQYTGNITGSNVWYGVPASNIGTAFQTMNITDNSHMLGDSGAATYIGPPVTGTKEFLDIAGGSVYTSTYAQGSTNLAYNATAYWNLRDTTQAPNNTVRHGMAAQRNWWKAMVAHQAASRIPSIRGIYWYQGEQDATTQADADAYQTNLSNFIDDFRAELGFSAALAPWYTVRIHSGINIGVHPYRDTVRTAQVAATSSKVNAYNLSVDGYTLFDNAHINMAGVVGTGTDFATLAAAWSPPA